MDGLALITLISLPVIWAILEETYTIQKYGKNFSGVVYRNILFRFGYVFTPIPLLLYLLFNNNSMFILVFIGWLILIKTMAIPQKSEYNYNDSLKTIFIYILIIILLGILFYMIL